ncbi:MAG: chaperone modulator CbpM [Gammaproteobacteria bacterium]
MRIELTELEWLDAVPPLSLSSLTQVSGLTESELRELVACELISPQDSAASSWSFAADQIAIARTAHRLRDDFELDLSGLVVALTLLERVQTLEQQIKDLDARLPRPMD